MRDDPRSKTPNAIKLGIGALIVYSIVTSALETMPEFSAAQRFFKISEAVVVIIFTAEFVVFWVLSKHRLRYPFRFLNLVDLLAIVPFYLTMAIDLRAVRVFRLLRLARILKLGRYSRAMQTLGEAARRVAPEFVMTAIIAGLVIILSAFALYYAEHDAQPEVYSSVPASLWWAVVTLTTVGYGDVYPQTPVGKIVASVIMLTGISFVAIPAGLFGSAMTEVIREQRESNKSGNSAGR